MPFWHEPSTLSVEAETKRPTTMGCLTLVSTLFRHHRRRFWVRLIIPLLFIITIDLILTTSLISGPSQFAPFPAVGSGVINKEKIYIASLHWNGADLIRKHWAPAVLDLVRHYGADNIYISIIEGGSFDDAKDALKELDAELGNLGVQRNIVLKEATHEDEVMRTVVEGERGWVWTPRHKLELRRIPYLADLRNEAMSKFHELAARTDGTKMVFDKVLWLNDVIFTVQDIIELLGTRGGDFSSVCALDFSHPPLFYDTFALRDSNGDRPITMTWPYFLSSASRKAMISNLPVPVKSCWNGLAVFQANSFYGPNRLKFRGIPDSLAAHHLEGSECCLIHTDNRDGATWRGVWLNPNVRVSYNEESDKAVRTASKSWPSGRQKMLGIWKNRCARLAGWPGRALSKHAVRQRVRKWKSLPSEAEIKNETGVDCIIDEMQVLVHNGWKHV
jgi:hypothetical protein